MNETAYLKPPGAMARFLDSDLWFSFRSSPAAMLAALMAATCLGGALLGPALSHHDPQDLATLDLMQSRLPPAWLSGGSSEYLLGTDEQGRDIFSAILYGTRISLIVGLASVLISVTIGVCLGLWAGFAGGRTDAVIMRLCDVMLSFPAILVALLIDGVGRAFLPHADEALAFGVLIFAISMTGWVQYARTVRGCTLVERDREYVQAARLAGARSLGIMRRHVLPNVLGPVFVLGTIQVASAIIIEATLSFLGVGVPITSPSLGTLIRAGNAFLFSGEWWIVVFPGVMLMAIALSVNVLGDWLRDAFNPRLG